MPKVKSALKLRALLLKHGTGEEKINKYVDPIFVIDRVTGKAVDCDPVLVVRALEDAPRNRVSELTIEKAKELMETGKWVSKEVVNKKNDPFAVELDDEDELPAEEEKPKKGRKKKEEVDSEPASEPTE